MYENRRFLIFPTSVTESIDFQEVYETSIESLRLSNDGSKTFVKYDSGSRPGFYSSSYEEMTYNEIIPLLTSSAWIIEEGTNPPE